MKLEVVEVALEVQEALVAHDVLEPLVHLVDLGRVATEDVGQVLVEAVGQHALDARRIDALRVSPAFAEFARLRAVGAKRAMLQMLSQPGAEQHSLGIGVEANPLEAAKWRLVAKAAGVADDKLDLYVAALPDADRAKAETAAAEWRERRQVMAMP